MDKKRLGTFAFLTALSLFAVTTIAANYNFNVNVELDKTQYDQWAANQTAAGKTPEQAISSIIQSAIDADAAKDAKAELFRAYAEISQTGNSVQLKAATACMNAAIKA